METKLLEEAHDLLLEMGAIIRLLDENSDHSEYWANDGDYIPDNRFKGISDYLKRQPINRARTN